MTCTRTSRPIGSAMAVSEAGQFAGDAAHRHLGLVPLLLTAQPQLCGDRAGPPTRAAAPVPLDNAEVEWVDGYSRPGKLVEIEVTAKR